MSITKGTYGTLYYVHDMKKAVDYYKTIFGLKARYESNEWTEFDLGDNTAICLHIADGKHETTPNGKLIAKVQDIKNLVPELKKKGVEFYRDISEVHPGAFCAEFKDPAGNFVSIYEDTNHR